MLFLLCHPHHLQIPQCLHLLSPLGLGKKGLGFIHLNIQSIIQHEKLDKLKILVTQTNPDVITLSETWLKCSLSDSELA